jgi:FMN phosphatase YigB (HAD superfamily)
MTHWERANDAIQVISSLKRRGTAVGLVTNFDHYPFIRELVDRLGLNSLIDAIVISSEVGSDKPDLPDLRIRSFNAKYTA